MTDPHLFLYGVLAGILLTLLVGGGALAYFLQPFIKAAAEQAKGSR